LSKPSVEEIGQISFVESIAVLDRNPAELGHDATIVFFNDSEVFNYARPDALIDRTSGILCCPNNYDGHDDLEGVLRLTWLADHERWLGLDEEEYREQKRVCLDHFFECGRRFIPDFDKHVVCTDSFTPRTIMRYTGHVNGAVYGSPRKRRDGRTALSNLFLCGTDQGFLGIIGAMLSGITIANLHVLSEQ
jgi:phytoene dehydrogenase-like protein